MSHSHLTKSQTNLFCSYFTCFSIPVQILHPGPQSQCPRGQNDQMNDLRIRIFFWWSSRTVCCKASSLLCSSELLSITEAASLWISRKMLQACRDRSESCCRMLLTLSQLTSFSDVQNCKPCPDPWSCPASASSVFNLHKFWGSTVRLWKGMSIQGAQKAPEI